MLVMEPSSSFFQALGGPITAQRNSQRASAKRGLDADPVIAKHVSFPPSTTCEGSEEPLHTSIPPHDVLQATPALGPPRSTPPLLGIERSFEVKPSVLLPVAELGGCHFLGLFWEEVGILAVICRLPPFWVALKINNNSYSV